jgi:osmotically-inducible protein OsmY
MSRLITFALGAAAGAAARHFLNSSSRSQLRDQALSKARSGAQQAATGATHAASKAKGAVATATPGPTRLEDADDVTLARKVETEIFRDADAPKGDVSIDVQAGVVYLRGAVADESWIERFADGARRVDGVKGVKNLLHRTGTPAPTAEPRGAAQERL